MLGITEVIENLYISGLETRQAILNKGIRCVLNVSSECPVQDLGANVDYEKISLLDLPSTSIQPYFDRLTDRIHQNLQNGKKTLVHCYVGRSRSASIILGRKTKRSKFLESYRMFDLFFSLFNEIQTDAITRCLSLSSITSTHCWTKFWFY